MAEDVQDDELSVQEEQDVVAEEVGSGEEQEDARLADDDHDEGDEPHVEGDSEEVRQAKLERNRARRKAAKDYRREKMESFKRDLAARDAVINELTQRLAVVERRSTGAEMAQLETAEKEAIHYYNQFKQLNAEAIERADGKTALDAQEKMFAARQRFDQIQKIKQAMTQKQAPQQQPLDPRLKANAESWMERNSWYDPAGSDEDSSLVLAIDQRLAAQGWDPNTKEYWEELDARVKKYLPHRSNQGYTKPSSNSAKPRGVPVAGSGRESSGNNSSGGYRLSAERVSALKEAGLWDDPKARAEAIKRFQAYDKEQRA